MFTKKHAMQNRAMLARALRELDHNDTNPLNQRADRDQVMDIMATVFPDVREYRRKHAIAKAINIIKARAIRRMEESDNG